MIKKELDASIDPATMTALCMLESGDGGCLTFTAHREDVITIRLSEHLMELDRQHHDSDRTPDDGHPSPRQFQAFLPGAHS